jgi:hypothetical protein
LRFRCSIVVISMTHEFRIGGSDGEEIRTKSVKHMELELGRNHRRYSNIFETAPDNIVYGGCDHDKGTITLYLYTTLKGNMQSADFQTLILSDFSTSSVDSLVWRVCHASVSIYDTNNEIVEDHKKSVEDKTALRVVVKFPMTGHSDTQNTRSDVENELTNTAKVVDARVYHQLLATAVTKCSGELQHLEDVSLPVSISEERAHEKKNQVISTKPFRGFIIMEVMDGDLNNGEYTKYLSCTRSAKANLNINYTGMSKRLNNPAKVRGTMWSLMNLIKELFYQSLLFSRKEMVHCNLHEGNVRFKLANITPNKETLNDKVQAVPRVHTHICGLRDLHPFTSKINEGKVNFFQPRCRYVPHYAKKDETSGGCMRTPRTITAFGIGTMVYRLLLRMACIAIPKNEQVGTDKHKGLMVKIHAHLGSEHKGNKQPPNQREEQPQSQPDRQTIVTVLTGITEVFDISILENHSRQKNFIHFIALCVSGELQANVFEEASKISVPNKFVSDFVKNVFSEPLMISGGVNSLEDKAFRDTPPLGVAKVLQLEILALSSVTFQELKTLIEIWGMSTLELVPFQIVINQFLCETPDNRQHVADNRHKEFLASQHVFKTLAHCHALESLTVGGGGCFTNLLSLGRLSKLKKLSLCDCPNLTDLAVKNFPNLEEMKLNGVGLSNVCKELSACANLKILELIAISDTTSLCVSSLAELETISIQTNSRLESIDGLRKCTKLKELRLQSVHALKNVEGLSACINLNVLHLSRLQVLETVEGLSGCINLKVLHLSRLPLLKTVKGLSGCTNLKELELSELPFLKTVEGLSGCTNLEELELSKLPLLKTVEELSGCTKLKKLELAHLPFLEKVEGLSGCINLEELDLSNLRRFTEFEGHGNLTTLLIYDMSSVTNIGLSGYTSLENLYLGRAVKLETLSLQNVPALKKMMISYCPLLKNIDGLSDCTDLNEFNMLGLDSIKTVTFSKLSNLNKIQLENLPLLERIDGLPDCTNLGELHLTHLDSLKILSLENLSNLNQIQLENLELLERIDGLPDCTNLGELHLTHLDSLKILSLENLSNLNQIQLENLPLLERIDGLADCTNLGELHLTQLDSLKILSLENLSNLNRIQLLDLELLERIDGLPDCTNLGELHLTHLDSLKILSLENLSNLKRIELLDLGLLERIDGLPGCTNLGELHLKHLNSLEILSLENLSSVVTVALRNLRSLKRTRHVKD